MTQALSPELDVYLHLGLVPVPLKPQSKEPAVKWGDEWNPTHEEIERWFLTTKRNICVSCGERLDIIDCDSSEAYHNFIVTFRLPPNCPLVRTGRSYQPDKNRRRVSRSI
jgi:hypothetical protein